MSKDLGDIKFDFIRYANCWEDAELLIQGLQPRVGSRLISICSAGDNTFSLLTTRPKEIIAADVNSTQLFLTALKIAAIRNLDRENYLRFAGFRECYERWDIYQRFKKDLDSESKLYWDNHKREIENGIIFNGKFEKYFRFFSKRILPLIHSKKNREKMFAGKNESDQQKFYNDTWNNRRWRIFFRLFFSKFVMGKFGRDPKFLEQVKMNVSDYIFARSAAHLSSVAARDNYMLHFILQGQYGNRLPHYVKEENYSLIQNQVGKIILKKGLIQDIAGENGKFDGFNLSDIFEYLPEDVFREISMKLFSAAETNAKFAYWNLMVPRNMSEVLPGEVKRNESLSEELTKIDKGFFYHKFCIDVAG
ncbi:MAG: DUF3419 family protein [Bacteroidota bacterium]